MVKVVKTRDASGSIIDGIVADYRWDASKLTFGFRQQDIDANGKSDFDEGNWRKFYEAIFNNASSFTKLSFIETSFETATLNQLMEVGGGGQSSNPYPELAEQLGGRAQTYTQINISGPVAEASEVIIIGRYSDVWFHEIGHSLGLRHTFEAPNLIDDNVSSAEDLGDHFLNSSLYSVMSYSPNVWGEDNPWTTDYDPGQTVVNAFAGSFMPIDIAALQQMYGQKAAATGDDIYVFTDDLVTNGGYRTIWDTGGVDTVRYDGNSAAKIDLRAATLRKEVGGGGFLSTSEALNGGFLIAHGVRIENASGGSGNDLVIGNGSANKLYGMAGNDWLEGGGGNDLLTGGAGADTFMFDNASVSGVDRITDFDADDRLYVTRALRDNNGDGIITFANSTLKLDGTDRGDRVILDGVNGSQGLIYMGMDKGFYVYALNDDINSPYAQG